MVTEITKDDAQRYQLLNEELVRFRDILVRKPEVSAMIVFGSIAEGRASENSDIDLLVVEESNVPFIKRIQMLRKLLKPKVATDIIAYTPEELEILVQSRPFVRDEILGKGKVLYERKHGKMAEICSR